MRLMLALILCMSYVLKDGVLSAWSWDESIHHAQVEHDHHDDRHSEEQHQNDDCCLVTHNFILSGFGSTQVPQPRDLETSFPSLASHYMPWTLAPPLRPPIA